MSPSQIEEGTAPLPMHDIILFNKMVHRSLSLAGTRLICIERIPKPQHASQDPIRILHTPRRPIIRIL